MSFVRQFCCQELVKIVQFGHIGSNVVAGGGQLQLLSQNWLKHLQHLHFLLVFQFQLTQVILKRHGALAKHSFVKDDFHAAQNDWMIGIATIEKV